MERVTTSLIARVERLPFDGIAGYGGQSHLHPRRSREWVGLDRIDLGQYRGVDPKDRRTALEVEDLHLNGRRGGEKSKNFRAGSHGACQWVQVG